MIRLNHVALFLPIIIGIVIVSVMFAVSVEALPILPDVTGNNISLTSPDGSVKMNKIFGTAIIYEKGSTSNQDIIISSYDIKSQRLNPQNGVWSDTPINNLPCYDDGFEDMFYAVDGVMVMECSKQNDLELLIILYSVSEQGVKVTAQYQSNHPQFDNTNFYRLVEEIEGDITMYDPTLEIIISDGVSLQPDTTTRLLTKTNSELNGDTITTEFTTNNKLKYGYMIEIVRDFDY